MSNRGGGKKRPAKLLVNLSGDDDSSSSPVNIPPPKSRQNYAGIQSAPGLRGEPFYSSSLVDPVIDEGEVMISTSLKSDSSTLDRRKEAASGGLGEYRSLQVQHYGTTGERDGIFGDDDSGLEQSTEIAEDYVKIAKRHKREDHGTTYVCRQMFSQDLGLCLDTVCFLFMFFFNRLYKGFLPPPKDQTFRGAKSLLMFFITI